MLEEIQKKRATIHDIAKALNVTPSTVSRALNGSTRISEQTKRSVRLVAEQLNYQPNTLAAALRNGKSYLIGIILPTVDRTFFSSVVRGIEEIANTANYHVTISQTYDSYKKEVATVQAMLNARVDGIIISHAKETKDFNHLLKIKERGIPVILFDRWQDGLQVSQVVIDDYRAAFEATEHLIKQGCKYIAHFTSSRKISVFKERLRGYKEALESNSLRFSIDLVLESNLQLEDGRTSMQRLLSSKQRPDGVFSASAASIMGALQICKENDIEVPNDIALVGFSNEPFTSFTEPPLSTVDQHSVQIGNAAAQLFLSEVSKSSGVVQKIVLSPTLIVRSSSLRKTINDKSID